MNINSQNYEEYFMLYADNELDSEQQQIVEEFLRANPDLKSEFDFFNSMKSLPDEMLLFPGKTDLYRSAAEERTIPMFRQWHAAAAILLIISGILIINQYSTRGVSFGKTYFANGMDAVNRKISSESNKIKENAHIKVNVPANDNPVMHTSVAAIKLKKKYSLKIKAEEKSSSKILSDETDNSTTNNDHHITADIDRHIPEHATSIPDIAHNRGNVKEINMDAIIPEKISSTINNNEIRVISPVVPDIATSESYIQAKKNSIKGILRKTVRIIDKTADLRYTKQVNIRLGNIEVALH